MRSTSGVRIMRQLRLAAIRRAVEGRRAWIRGKCSIYTHHKEYNHCLHCCSQLYLIRADGAEVSLLISTPIHQYPILSSCLIQPANSFPTSHFSALILPVLSPHLLIILLRQPPIPPKHLLPPLKPPLQHHNPLLPLLTLILLQPLPLPDIPRRRLRAPNLA